MRKFLLLGLLLLMLLPVIASAQSTVPHDTQLTWGSPADATSASTYKVYKAPLSSPTASCTASLTTFVVISPSTTATLSYDDKNVSPGLSACYYVTHVLNGLESVPSNTIVATTPGPNAPSGLTAVSK